MSNEIDFRKLTQVDRMVIWNESVYPTANLVFMGNNTEGGSKVQAAVVLLDESNSGDALYYKLNSVNSFSNRVQDFSNAGVGDYNFSVEPVILHSLDTGAKVSDAVIKKRDRLANFIWALSPRLVITTDDIAWQFGDDVIKRTFITSSDKKDSGLENECIKRDEEIIDKFTAEVDIKKEACRRLSRVNKTRRFSLVRYFEIGQITLGVSIATDSLDDLKQHLIKGIQTGFEVDGENDIDGYMSQIIDPFIWIGYSSLEYSRR